MKTLVNTKPDKVILAIFTLSDIFQGKMQHHRLRVFKAKGFKCVSCETKGSFVVLEKKIGGDIHLDLYGINSNGDKVLMTIDHIKPKSLGGNNHIDNLQPMCCKCNSEKGSDYLETYKIGKI